MVLGVVLAIQKLVGLVVVALQVHQEDFLLDHHLMIQEMAHLQKHMVVAVEVDRLVKVIPLMTLVMAVLVVMV
jgi:hypothetical protein